MIPERVAVVKRIIDLYMQGHGSRAILKILNADNVPTFGRGREWTQNTVLKYLSTPALYGAYTPPSATHPIEGIYPAVISIEEYRRISARRKANTRLKGAKNTTGCNTIFTGLARCGECGSSLVFRKVKNRQGIKENHYLRCIRALKGGGCSQKSLRYYEIEDWFLKSVESYLRAGMEDKDNSEETHQKIDDLGNEITDLKEQINKLLELTLSGVGLEMVQEKVTTISAQIEEKERERNELIDKLSEQTTEQRQSSFHRYCELIFNITPENRTEVRTLVRRFIKEVVIHT